MRMVEIPLEFFKAIGEKPHLYRILWIKWLGEYADELANEDFIEKFISEHKDKNIKLDELEKAYRFGMGFFEGGFIFKSKTRRKNKLPPEQSKKVQAVLDYLNDKAGSNYLPNLGNSELILARFNEGYNLNDFQIVIDNKVDEWKGTEQAKYLRPLTLFQPKKFENYLHQPKKNTDGNRKKSNIEKLSTAASIAKKLLE